MYYTNAENLEPKSRNMAEGGLQRESYTWGELDTQTGHLQVKLEGECCLEKGDSVNMHSKWNILPTQQVYIRTVWHQTEQSWV